MAVGRRSAFEWHALLVAAPLGAHAVDYVGQQVRTAEEDHSRLQNFWRLGEGFEGTASDWTEYVVWLIGVIGFFFYIANPVRRTPDFSVAARSGQGLAATQMPKGLTASLTSLLPSSYRMHDVIGTFKTVPSGRKVRGIVTTWETRRWREVMKKDAPDEQAGCTRIDVRPRRPCNCPSTSSIYSVTKA
eukprot:scaffold102069_cov32-Tisochrysis_lutea.AAC.1